MPLAAPAAPSGIIYGISLPRSTFPPGTGQEGQGTGVGVMHPAPSAAFGAFCTDFWVKPPNLVIYFSPCCKAYGVPRCTVASSPSFTQTPQAPRPPLGQPHRGPSPIFSPSLHHLQPHRVVSGGLRGSHVGSRGGKWRKIPAQLRGPTTPERGGVGAQRGVLHNACAATPRHGRVKRGRGWNREFPGFPKPTSAPAPFTPQSKFPRERGRDIGVGEDRAAAL